MNFYFFLLIFDFSQKLEIKHLKDLNGPEKELFLLKLPKEVIMKKFFFLFKIKIFKVNQIPKR